MVPRNPKADVEAVERAMVAIRRSQSRRTLAQRARGDPGDAVPARLTSSGFEVLDAIEAAEQGGSLATVSDVAQALHLDQPRASRLVTAAVEAGLARREADQSDGRRALLALTEAGHRVCDRVHESRRALFANAMVGWSPGDRSSFARLLSRFIEDLAASNRQGPGGGADPDRRRSREAGAVRPPEPLVPEKMHYQE